MKKLFQIAGYPAICAVRLAGSWIIQLPYGRDSRLASEEESAIINATWDGEHDGGGNDYHFLGNAEDLNTL